jgi:hypothetical protein
MVEELPLAGLSLIFSVGGPQRLDTPPVGDAQAGEIAHGRRTGEHALPPMHDVFS